MRWFVMAVLALIVGMAGALYVAAQFTDPNLRVVAMVVGGGVVGWIAAQAFLIGWMERNR